VFIFTEELAQLLVKYWSKSPVKCGNVNAIVGGVNAILADIDEQLEFVPTLVTPQQVRQWVST
jgi:hypothetical protein